VGNVLLKHCEEGRVYPIIEKKKLILKEREWVSKVSKGESVPVSNPWEEQTARKEDACNV